MLIALESSRKLFSRSLFSESRPKTYGMYTDPREQANRISMTIVSLNCSPRSRKGMPGNFMAPPMMPAGDSAPVGRDPGGGRQGDRPRGAPRRGRDFRRDPGRARSQLLDGRRSELLRARSR